MKNFVKLCATVYGGWRLAISYWRLANGQWPMAKSQKKKPTHPPSPLLLEKREGGAAGG